MKKNSNLSVCDYCDRHHAAGKEISVTWKLGSEISESVRIIPFNRQGLKDREIEEGINELVYSYIEQNACSFDYISTGKVSYDAVSKKFVGKERLEEFEIFNGECNVDIWTSNAVCFDLIEIHVTGGYATPIKAKVDLLMNNGPIMNAAFENELKSLERSLTRQFKKTIPRQGLLNINMYYTIGRSEFVNENNILKFKIEHVEYEYKDVKNRSVVIPISG